jgi:HPt (histidine-containing phosphotransfer) domain-containing protein
MESTNANADKKYTDLTYLKELSEGSNEFAIEMIDQFLTQTPVMLENMKTYLNEKKWKELRDVAHKMKSSSDFVGIHSIKEILITVEKYAGEQINLEQLPGLVAEITNSCSVAFIELKNELKNFQ